MRIALRTDANSQIGTGHFIRCLTLADALKKRGAQIRFISRGLSKHLHDMLKKNDIEFVPLPPAAGGASPADELSHSHWLGTSQTHDASDSITALADKNWDWLIVDHYALDKRWESMLRQTATKIMVIDDIADRQHDCDLLLDQNFYRDMTSRYNGKAPSHCQLLLGPRYALLRDEFRQLHEQVKPRGGPAKRIFVFFGGVDADNYSGLAIEALSEIDIHDFHVDVVIGAQHPYREEIQAACVQHEFACHIQTDRMAELMAAADLAIGAGGSATWERCCLGLPTLAFCTADNQKNQISDAAQEGLIYSPEIMGSLKLSIERHVSALIENIFLRQFISCKSMKMVDGRGILRVTSELGYIGACGGVEAVDVRLAVADDALLIWPWRNAEATRRYFFDPSPVSLNTHLTWWDKNLSDLQSVLLIGRLDGRECSVIRYDFVEPRQAKVSIYLNPEMTGKGLGKYLLRAGQDWLLQNHPEIGTVIASILPNNIASLQVFLAAGFKEQQIVLTHDRN